MGIPPNYRSFWAKCFSSFVGLALLCPIFITRAQIPASRSAVDLATGTYEPRDPAMGDNVAWVMQQLGAAGKVVIWAHNGHVSAAPYAPGYDTMGSMLRKRFGVDYVAIGTLFSRGEFQAASLPFPANGNPLVRAFRVGEAAPGSVESVLAETRLAALALDLRRLRSSARVQAWFKSDHAARSIGNRFDPTNELDFYESVVLADRFNMIVFVAHTTRSHPTANAQVKFRIDPN
ncbi:MAG TPA: erythromycin esterase family protein [Pyrinomonadaceae bacterium]|nr:erythromycin esterase family protein [Pyrinomonadaceae bacterium]